jgi:hypothetical protein
MKNIFTAAELQTMSFEPLDAHAPIVRVSRKGTSSARVSMRRSILISSRVVKPKARTAVVEALKRAGDGPLTPNQIASRCGMKPVNIRGLLATMLADGVVKKASYGKYFLVGIVSAASLRPPPVNQAKTFPE